tara:strand:+ start:117 stop:692 length:576 start_codon:yes stop_codon:yes gene_type:complete
MKISMKILLMALLISMSANAGLILQYSAGYHTSSDDADNGEYSSLKNQIFLGATFLKSHMMALGWNYMMNSRTLQGEGTDTASDLSVTEMGPRLFFFLNQSKTFVLSANWNPFVSGDRTLTTVGTAEEVSGSSLHAALSVQAKVGNHFYIGGGLNYHSVSISKSTVNGTETEVSHGYTDIYPSIEFSYRFK